MKKGLLNFNLQFNSIYTNDAISVALDRKDLVQVADKWFDRQFIKGITFNDACTEIFNEYICILNWQSYMINYGFDIIQVINKCEFEEWVNEVVLDCFIEALIKL